MGFDVDVQLRIRLDKTVSEWAAKTSLDAIGAEIEREFDDSLDYFSDTNGNLLNVYMQLRSLDTYEVCNRLDPIAQKHDVSIVLTYTSDYDDWGQGPEIKILGPPKAILPDRIELAVKSLREGLYLINRLRKDYESPPEQIRGHTIANDLEEIVRWIRHDRTSQQWEVASVDRHLVNDIGYDGDRLSDGDMEELVSFIADSGSISDEIRALAENWCEQSSIDPHDSMIEPMERCERCSERFYDFALNDGLCNDCRETLINAGLIAPNSEDSVEGESDEKE